MMMNVMRACGLGADVRSLTHRLMRAAVALFAAGLSAAAMAQDVPGDPPGRVARLADFSGQAWVYTPEGGEWIAAVRNQPLTSGDRLATDTGARAEVRVGSTTLRLDAGSELEVVQLDDAQVALQLHSGSLAARVRTAEAANELSVGTDDGLFRAQQPGRYRFDHLNSVSGITVLAGQGSYEGDGVALTVGNGQHAEFWIDAQHAAQYALSAPLQDAFAAWVNERDISDDRYAAAPAYVSPEMTGGEDLARYGNWEQTPDEGAVWIPSGVAADWAPYSTGHWAFVRPWGWTWIDDAPWGFAPFHYGRWLRVRDRWCWTPGSFVARPVYAPALVAWVGGVGVSVAVGGPPVGWFPLAPRDVYVPSYRYSPRYVREINIASVRDTAQINRFVNLPPAQRDFGNRRFPNAVTIVPASVMTSRQPVGPAAAQMRGTPTARELANQPARGLTLAAPPVAAPPPVRRADPRTIQPPFAAERQAAQPRSPARQPMPVQRPSQEAVPAAQPQFARPVPAPVARPAAPAPEARPVAPLPEARPVSPAPEVRPAGPAPGARPVAPAARIEPPAAAIRPPSPDERRPIAEPGNDPRATRAPQRNEDPRPIPVRPQPQRSEPAPPVPPMPQRVQAEPRQAVQPARPQPEAPHAAPRQPDAPRPSPQPGRAPDARPAAEPSSNRGDQRPQADH